MRGSARSTRVRVGSALAVAAMWSGGPATGVWAPNRGALVIHTVSSAGLAAGVWMLRPTSGG